MQSLGEIIRVSPNQNGFYALRSAFVLASDSSGTFTLLDVLHQFPADTINIDAQAILKLADIFKQLQTETQQQIAAIKQQATVATVNHNKSATDFTQQPDLQKPGSFTWHQENLALYDQKRDRSLAVTLYRPQINLDISVKVPLVIISPGFSTKKETFSYLAQHIENHFNPQLARSYIKVMSLAFMQNHVVHQAKYRRFLTNNYARHISQKLMKLNLVNYSSIKSNR